MVNRWAVLLAMVSLLICCRSVVAAAPDKVPLVEFIDAYAQQEKKDIILDQRVVGHVQLSSGLTPGRISREEFHGVLMTHHYAAYEVDDVIRVLPLAAVKQQKLPFYDGGQRGDLVPTQVVNAVIPVHTRPPEGLVGTLRPLVPQWGYVAADSDANALVVVSTVENIEQLIELIRRLER